MKQFSCNDNAAVLLVGEGNFSFARSLYTLKQGLRLTATCQESTILDETVKKNVEFLERNGVRVLLGIDGTKLETHSELLLESFDIISFNFPHVGGKMRIEKNRDLLKAFFLSAEKLSNSCTRIVVTLCNGQGGTSFDKPQRRWDDTWKIREMAAHGNFILSEVLPFDTTWFEGYTVTGYRGLDKQFSTENSLSHLFRLSDSSDFWNSLAPSIDLDASIFSSKNFKWKEMVPSTEVTLELPIFTFDITFTRNSEFEEANFYETLYKRIGGVVVDIEYIGDYIFPCGKRTLTYRITYSSSKVPLYRKRVLEIHESIVNLLEHMSS